MDEIKKEKVVQNIDHLNKAIPTPLPDKINDIDVDGTFYQTIIDGAEAGTLDLNQVDSLSNVSRTRDNVYNLLDMMGEDPIISSALNIYAADVCEPNDKGQIVWAVSDDDECLHCVSKIIDSLNLDKNMYSWVYSLIKYGDLYLRLYRNSEYNEDTLRLKEIKEKSQLNESREKLDENVIVKAYSKNDHYAEYMEAIKNPAEVFNLTKFGKTCGFIRTHILPGRMNNLNDVMHTRQEYQFLYQFNQQDVDVFEATEMVHASLEDNSDRTQEEISLLNTNEKNESTELRYTVKRGQSILYNSFKIWRELKLLENAVLLNRLTKSSVVRAVNVEVGDMDKVEARAVIARVKQMIEQKAAINTNTSMTEYTNAGPVQNTIYMPTHEGIGNITVAEIGGNTQVGDLTDLDYWKNKLYASLAIPGGYLGEGDAEGSLFNNGNSLSLKSSRYAKSVKRIQNAVIQAVTDGINLILLDRGLVQYINKFQIKMQVPETQEEKDRKEGMNNSIATIQNVMGLLDGIENPKTKLEILKTLLAEVINDSDVINLLQEEIDRLEENEEFNLTGGDGDFDGEFGGGGGLPGGAITDGGGSTEMDLGDENAEPFENEEGGEAEGGEEPAAEVETEENPAEAFYNNKGGERLNEKGDLPSFADLGISYTQVR